MKVYQQAEVVNLELKQEIFADDSFDAVTCVGTTSYLHDFNMIFGEWCRFTKKGGKIVFTHRTNIWDSDEHQVRTFWGVPRVREFWCPRGAGDVGSSCDGG